MECAVFALAGVVIGAVLTLFAKGEIKLCKKHKDTITSAENEEEHGAVKSDQQLMRQWQNLLRYGTESEAEPYV